MSTTAFKNLDSLELHLMSALQALEANPNRLLLLLLGIDLEDAAPPALLKHIIGCSIFLVI